MRNKRSIRILALLLLAVLVFSSVPRAFAAAAEPALADTTAASGSPPPDAPDVPTPYASTIQAAATPVATVYGDSSKVFTYTYDHNGTTITKTMTSIDLRKIRKWMDGSTHEYYLYCIEPPVDTNGKYENSNTIGVDGVWGSLTLAQKHLVGLALLYGFPNEMTSGSLGTQISMQTATAMVVWEIVLDMRDSNGVRTDNRIKDLFCGTCTVEDHINGAEWTTAEVATYYALLDKAMSDHFKIPSFTDVMEQWSPTITLWPDGTGKYTATVTDANGILEKYTFPDTGNIHYSVSGNRLTITASGPFSPVTVSPSKQIPSLERQAFIVWGGWDTNKNGQICVSTDPYAGEPVYDPVPAYFKLQMPNGSLKIIKTSEDGKIAGFTFRIKGMGVDRTVTTGTLDEVKRPCIGLTQGRFAPSGAETISCTFPQNVLE